MRAAVYHGRGDVRVEDVPQPSEPAATEVLLEVTRGAICGTDASEYATGPHLIPRGAGPVVLGHEFTGRVVAAGSEVEGLRPGMRVVPGAGMWCGACPACKAGRTNLCRRYYTLGLQADGGLAEYALAPSAMCLPVPDGCSDDAAAIAQPFAVALHAVRRGGIQPGETVVVVGVGGIGAFIVAAAKARGAAPVVAADIREARLEHARDLGADHLVDVRSDDLVETVQNLTGGDGADAVVEASGRDGAAARAAACARRGGRVVLVGLPAQAQLLELSRLTLAEIDLIATVAHVCKVDLPEALGILASTDIAQVVTDRVIPLSAIVEEGLAPLAAGTVDGKVLVSVTA
jgi:threonine dehydrogenase-like Zn-dependent dehydrogenase